MTEIFYRVDRAKDGSPIIIILREGREFPLHSRVDPVREGEKTSPEFNPAKHDIFIALGCGMGYHLNGLSEIADKYRAIIVIDILPGLKEIIDEGGCSGLGAAGKNIIFLTGMDLSEVEKELADLIDLENCRGIQVAEHPQSFRLFPEYYEAVKASVKRVLDKKSGDMATVRAFGSIFLRNAMNNLKNFSRVSPVSALEGKFKGSSALIISSAPSVERYIDDIKKHRDRFYIIAVDSALPMLSEHGIKPEFAVSIDPQQRIHEHFLGHDGTGIARVFSIVSPPSIVERYGGFISLNSHPVSQVIDELYPGVTGRIDSGTGSVAGDALCLALLAGFDNIGMTGFDFSFSHNIIYARGTSYQKRYSLYFNNRFVTPEGFNASYIFRGSGGLMAEGRYTRKSFLAYRDSLVKLISERCAAPPVIINSSGLAVSSGRYMDISEFAENCDGGKGSDGVTPAEILDKSVKLKDIIDRKRITEFLAGDNVKKELLKHSLASEFHDKRSGRFSKLFIN